MEIFSTIPFAINDSDSIEHGHENTHVVTYYGEARNEKGDKSSEPENLDVSATGISGSLEHAPSNGPRTQSQALSSRLNPTKAAELGHNASEPCKNGDSRGREGHRNQRMLQERQAARFRKEQAPFTDDAEKGQSTLRQQVPTPTPSCPVAIGQSPDIHFGGDGTSDEMTVRPTYRVYRYGEVTPPRGPAAQRRNPVQRNLLPISCSVSSHGRPANTSVRSAPQDRGRYVVRGDEDWQTWVEIGVKVFGLPTNSTTLDIYRLFSKEGSIETIEIFENTRGIREGNARIRFRPPPAKPFWNTESYVITTEGSDEKTYLRLELDVKRRSFLASSPVNNDVKYLEMTILKAESLDFGFMVDPSSMMTMNKTNSNQDTATSFGLNLLRREIDVQFQLTMTDPRHKETPAKEYPDLGKFDRKETFRFRLPFAQLNKIYELEVGREKRVLFITLENPPNFYRRTRYVENTHEASSTYWVEWDSWYRQTDVVYDPTQLKFRPLTLKKTKPIIDIGRWTTYRFVFDCTKNDAGVYNMMFQALADHNIEKVTFAGYNMVEDQEQAVWDWIDKPIIKSPTSNTFLAEMGESSIPPLSFPVRYQLEVCISQGCLNEHNLSKDFVDRLALLEESNAKDILEYVAEQKTRYYNPMDIFGIRITRGSASRKIPAYCAYTRSATVTPSTVYYSTPTVETSNRIIRRYAHYADRFLRVRFTDEKFQGRINATDKSSSNEIFTRIKRAMTNGITIGERHFEFLAFGNSQFREHGAYFFAPLPYERAEDIRLWMGNFDSIKVVAKYAARLGQCFSTTRAINGTRVEIRETLDIERNGYNFTDGVGMISSFLAKMVASELGLTNASEQPPSLYQFRLGGCKGVLAISPEARMREMFIRPSQYKFPAAHNGLEIIRWSQFAAATLNRQIIIVLSALGVPDGNFVFKLKEMLKNLAEAMTDEKMALKLLQKHVDPNQMTMNLASLVLEGFMRTKEPFVTSLLQLWRAWSIKYLKSHAKIVIEQGAFLLGCVDETATLKGHFNHGQVESGKDAQQHRLEALPEIFVQVSDPENKGRHIVIEGVCLFARNPSLHPGDIRIVRAVNVPALHHLRDVVVLPQTGDRDIASMCSGGDLDGDDYLVIWDKDLIPPEWNHEPMDYTPPQPRKLNREVTVDDITSFFVTYMKNDRLPTIALAHLATADAMDDGVKDEKCLKLAGLHSMAVDYVKSGQPAHMPKELRVRRWPHFMEKQHIAKEQLYISGKVLGQLYDQVERIDFVPQLENPFDERILQAYHLDDEILKAASQIKEEYDAAIRRIMAQHEIQTEFEVWSTFVLSHAGQSKDYKFHEEIGQISGALKDRFSEACREKAGGKDFEKLGPFVAAMYSVTQEEMAYAVSQCRQKKIVGGREVPLRKMEAKSMPLMSFPWLFPSVLGKIANGVGRADGDPAAANAAAESQHRRLKKSAAAEGSTNEDLIETAEGVTHRGEVLELFHHGDEQEPAPSNQIPLSRGSVGSENMRANPSWDDPLGDEALGMYLPEQPIRKWAAQEQSFQPGSLGVNHLLDDDDEYHAEDEAEHADSRYSLGKPSGKQSQVGQAVQQLAEEDLLIDLDIEDPPSNLAALPPQPTSKPAPTELYTANHSINRVVEINNHTFKRLTDSDNSENDAIHFTPQRSDGEEDLMPTIEHESYVQGQEKPSDNTISGLDADEDDDDVEEEAITLDVQPGKSALEALMELSLI
ncbi:MAG: hypothetical protein M1836_007865 [Candelina mexicana]|nr:MAG: hypothetical protein M1836_007865 [Candelina mexicana]